MSPKPGTAAQESGSGAAPLAPSVTLVPLADGESGKIARIGLVRDQNLLYYVAKGDVWATAKRSPGKAATRAFVVVKVGLAMDFERYLYYLDNDGDVARKSRVVQRGAR
jgi:hypothetical protein